MPSKNHIAIFVAVLALGCLGVAGAENVPLVNIINITKVVSPLSLPAGGGEVAFTYKVTNPSGSEEGHRMMLGKF